MKKLVLSLVVLVLLALVGWKVYEKIGESAVNERRGRGKPKVAVEIQPIRKSGIADVGVFTGSLKPKSLFLVAPKVPGRLERMMVNIGDHLVQNQLIASLDDAEFQQELQQAEAYLDVAKANLEAAADLLKSSKRELARIQSLKEKKLISASDLDSAQGNYTTQLSKYKIAKAQLSEKEAAYKVAKIRQSYTEIRSIWSENGANLVVGERFVDEGALLTANSPIISVIDISSMVGVIHVTETEYFKVRLGHEAIISVDALKDMKFKGVVVRISPLVKEATREAQIELEIDNPTGILKPGLFIRASIQFAYHDDVTVIPISALVKRDEKTGVFVADLQKNLANFIQIETGIAQDNLIEVVKPAMQGSVVTLGQHLLEDGSAIIVSHKEVAGDDQETSQRIVKKRNSP